MVLWFSLFIYKSVNYVSSHKNKNARSQCQAIIWFIFAGSKGGNNRIRIMDLLKKQPYNTNQLSEMLEIDYKAVQHHLKVLEKNNLISKIGDKYDVLYFISNYLEGNIKSYYEVRYKVISNKKIKEKET